MIVTLETAGYYLTGLQGCGCRTNKGFWPVIGGIPILLMWKRYRDRCRRRHATRNLHGLARGRMPLRDGNVVDALRDGNVVRSA